MTKMFAI